MLENESADHAVARTNQLEQGDIPDLIESHRVDDEGDDDGYAPIDWLADSHNEPTAAIARASNDRLQSTGIVEALDGLDERSRRIIEARWLTEEGESLTLHDLAAEFQVSAERIRQIETKALQKMKQVLLPATV